MSAVEGIRRKSRPQAWRFAGFLPISVRSSDGDASGPVRATPACRPRGRLWRPRAADLVPAWRARERAREYNVGTARDHPAFRGSTVTRRTSPSATASTLPQGAPRRRNWTTCCKQVAPRQGRWREEDYLWLTDCTSRRIELTDGHVEVLPMPTDEHQCMVAYLYEVRLRAASRGQACGLRRASSGGSFRDAARRQSRGSADRDRRQPGSTRARRRRDYVLEYGSRPAETLTVWRSTSSTGRFRAARAPRLDGLTVDVEALRLVREAHGRTGWARASI